MGRFFRSFYARIAAIFLVLLFILGAALALTTTQSAIRLTEAADQQLNRDLARTLAPQFQPYLITDIDQEAILEIIDDLMVANRRIGIYLLGSEGMIKSAFVEPGREVAMPVVDVEPLDRLMAGADDFPVLGDDPLHPGRQRPFSVAPIIIMGEEGCYLYITLGTDAYDSALAMMRESYIADGILRSLPLMLLLTAIAGLILFRLLTRRLRRMTGVVEEFERGHYGERVAVAADDEVGQLAASFNAMADTIVANLDELKRNDQLRRELVANVSHDLRSPLASIQGYLETILMKQDELGPAQRTEYLEIALRNANRLSALVAELFELSKFDAQEVEPHVEPFSVAELIQDVVAQFQQRAESCGVRLTATLPAGLPPVHADIGLIERAITNLVDNALRHTSSEGEVEVAPTLEDGRVVVRVSDTGSGIAPEDLPRIFDRFYRDDAARTWTPAAGAGLGLSITKKILDLHGSEMFVESEPDKGSVFAFELPTAPPLEARRPAARPTGEPAETVAERV